MTEILMPSDQKAIDLAIKLREESGSMYSDLTAERLYRQWLHDAFTLTPNVKDEIGMLWMRHILGVNEGIARNFDDRNNAEGEEKTTADVVIAMYHMGIKNKNDHISFWIGVSELDNGLLYAEDRRFLVEKDVDGGGAWLMINVFNMYNPNSRLLKDLVENAIAYN